MYYQHIGAGKRENHNIGIGNVDYLEEWGDFLPSYPIDVENPWFYGMEQAMAFPIWPKNSLTKAEHRYTFRKKVSDLLRVEYLHKDGQWKPMTKKIHQVIDIEKSATIKTPEIWARYSYVTENELQWHRECEGDKIYYIHDVVKHDISNPIKYKNTSTIDLISKNPCLALFWVAENCDATTIHNYSNYTTNTHNLYKGWDPIKTNTLTYGEVPILDKMPSHHFNIGQSRRHSLSSPSEPGYHGYFYASDSTNFNGDIAIVLGELKAKLECYIENNNIFTNSSYSDDDDDDKDIDIDIAESASSSIKSIDSKSSFESGKKLLDNNQDESPRFLVRSRLLVLRKFTIKKNGDLYKFEIM
jgi:hypothetical protein